MEIDSQTIALTVILGALLYMQYVCSEKRNKKLINEGFRIPMRCKADGDFYRWHGIQHDPYYI